MEKRKGKLILSVWDTGRTTNIIFSKIFMRILFSYASYLIDSYDKCTSPRKFIEISFLVC